MVLGYCAVVLKIQKIPKDRNNPHFKVGENLLSFPSSFNPIPVDDVPFGVVL